jgi:hypothetical protein
VKIRDETFKNVNGVIFNQACLSNNGELGQGAGSKKTLRYHPGLPLLYHAALRGDSSPINAGWGVVL